MDVMNLGIEKIYKPMVKRMTTSKQYRFEISHENEPAVAAFLAQETGISKTKIKDSMAKGAVWLTRNNQRKRIRRVTSLLEIGDVVELFYDENILNSRVPDAKLLKDENDFSVWYKPSGLMTQGTDFGDHCALEHIVERILDRKRSVYLVHRIDREASGLVLVAHTKRMAGELSRLFRDQEVEKFYWIRVKGIVGDVGATGIIEKELDGKRAETHYSILGVDKDIDETLLLVNIKTGRRHQIRRHFEAMGFPVMGDPLYGIGNKNKTGMKLIAWLIRFQDPVLGIPREYNLKNLCPDVCAEFVGNKTKNEVDFA